MKTRKVVLARDEGSITDEDAWIIHHVVILPVIEAVAAIYHFFDRHYCVEDV